MACVFCDIVRGKTSAVVVLEDALALAFLDKRPLFPGHILLIPKQHFETLDALPVDMIDPLFRNVQRLAAAVESALEAEGSFVALNNRVSQSVPHLHVHVVPRRKGDGLKGFFWPRHAYADEEAMVEVGAKIRAALL
jgi:histidine triad (HIT) family protein